NRFCETMRTAIKDGKSWKGTFLKSNKRGRELLLDATMTPVKDDNGVGNSLVFIARDVTERRRVEEKAKQIEKINALKTLTAGIAHEFSNALWIINGNVELMEGKAACKGIDKNVERIYKAVGRARTLVAQLRTFLEPDELEAKPLEIGLLVKEMVKQAAASAPRGVRVTYEIDTASCTVSIAPEYIQEIFKQIYSNALEALDGEEGHIHVELTIPTEDNEAGEPRSVRFTVSDDGCGMGRSDLEKVFDPFFSGKKDKEGLGLSMVHGIVKGAGGNISLYSTPGEGTTARVFLPIHYCRPSADPGGSGEKSACEGTPVSQSKAGNILVIDDDATICAMFKEVLEDRGYRVTCFSDSAEGFKQIQGNFALYDLLITDYHMPGIDGKSILSYVRGRNSRYPVILCSGDGLMKMNPPRADDKTGYLVKPVSKYEVLSLTEILLA
ncbi:MAG: ATP-binding protein, partial [Spirochaetia bacterium]